MRLPLYAGYDYICVYKPCVCHSMLVVIVHICVLKHAYAILHMLIVIVYIYIYIYRINIKSDSTTILIYFRLTGFMF